MRAIAGIECSLQPPAQTTRTRVLVQRPSTACPCARLHGLAGSRYARRRRRRRAGRRNSGAKGAAARRRGAKGRDPRAAGKRAAAPTGRRGSYRVTSLYGAAAAAAEGDQTPSDCPHDKLRWELR